MSAATQPALDRPWWTRRWYLALLCLLTAVPLLYPPVAPLGDLPGHIGRYRIQLGDSIWLARYYAVEWRPIGNLGFDLAVPPLAHLIGVEAAAKAILLIVPPLTAAGFLAVARELHGRAPPAAGFALPLILGYPFMFGFVNFALSLALAMPAWWLWLRLARTGRSGLRAALFVPLGLVVWTAHASGWAILLLCVAAGELVAARRRGLPWWRVPIAAGIACLPLGLPLAAMALWHGGGVAGETTGFLDWNAKANWIQSALRDRWVSFDGDGAVLLVGLIGLGVVGLLPFEPVLGIAALLLGAAYLALPQYLLGSNYADMRLAPVLMTVAILALGPPRARWPRWAAPALAMAALGFVVARVGAATYSLATLSRGYDRQLEAVAHLPVGARVYALVATPCPRGWSGPRLEEIAALATARREAFTNVEWTAAGAQLVTQRLDLPDDYATPPAQMVRLPGCDRPEPLLADRLRTFPRDRFTHVWLIDVPPAARPRDPGLVPIWASEAGALYRIGAAQP